MHSTAEPAERSQLSSWTLRQSCKVGSTSPAYRKGGRGSGAGGGGSALPVSHSCSVTRLRLEVSTSAQDSLEILASDARSVIQLLLPPLRWMTQKCLSLDLYKANLRVFLYQNL